MTTLEYLANVDRVGELLRVLTPKELAVVALVWQCGLSLSEAARELGISKQVACARISKARRRLVWRFPELAREREERSKSRGIFMPGYRQEGEQLWAD